MTHEGIIEWSRDNRDTISLEMTQYYENMKGVIKIKYNNEVVWDKTTSGLGNRYFQIVKKA